MITLKVQETDSKSDANLAVVVDNRCIAYGLTPKEAFLISSSIAGAFSYAKVEYERIGEYCVIENQPLQVVKLHPTEKQRASFRVNSCLLPEID